MVKKNYISSASNHQPIAFFSKTKKKPRGVRREALGVYVEEFIDIINAVYLMQGKAIEHSLAMYSFSNRVRLLKMLEDCIFLNIKKTNLENVYIISLNQKI